MDYLAMFRQSPHMGKTLDERFANVLDFWERGERSRKIQAEAKAAKEREHFERNERYRVARDAAIAKLAAHWQGIDTAPRDGTQFVGIMWDGEQWASATFEYSPCKYDVGDVWRVVAHFGYDMDGHEWQPEYWIAI